MVDYDVKLFIFYHCLFVLNGHLIIFSRMHATENGSATKDICSCLSLSGFNFLTFSVYRFSSICIWTDRQRRASSSSSDSPVHEPVDELFGQPVVHVAVDFKQGGKGKEHTAGVAVFWKDRHRLNKLTPLRGDKLTKDKAQLRGILESLTRPPIGMPVGQ